MIIVEGMDGSGKTTLAHQLSADCEIPLRDWGIDRKRLPDLGVRQRVYVALADSMIGHKPAFIHDRLFFSELVYGSVIRGNIVFGQREQAAIRRVIRAMGYPVICCIPPLPVVEENVRLSDDHIDGVTDNVEKLYSTYIRAMSGGVINNVLYYDYTGTNNERGILDYHAVAGRVQHYLEQREERSW